MMPPASAPFLRLHPLDDVAVLKRSLPAGEVLDSVQVTLAQAIPAGHKVALRFIAPDQPVRKYGQVIGFATRPIQPGDHVHGHNLEKRDFTRDNQFDPPGGDLLATPFCTRTFSGYRRPDGRVGTRNYLAVISSVNCSASVSHYVRDFFRTETFARDFPHVDGIIAFTHKSGCCVQPGEPFALLQRVLVGMATHPNVFGYVMIGLGCEGNQVDLLRRHPQVANHLGQGPAPTFLNIQAKGGIRKTVEAGVAAVSQLLPFANECRRTTCPVSSLVLAENCGGSDGNSGISANPALGVASDALVAQGGTSVLAETPEIYGAEHLLVQRAVNRAVGEKLLSFIHWWEEHARQHQATIDNNPSFGNKAGGLTTIYEKSLGAIAKAGLSPLREVYRYAEQVKGPGLCFMDTPGFDPVSMTGLVAGGCNIGVFTTGRGSVYGCKPTPCIKVSTNTPLFEAMPEEMDLNAGTILDGTETVEEVGQRLFEKILSVAAGEKTRSELAGLGDEEFAPWLLGPTF